MSTLAFRQCLKAMDNALVLARQRGGEAMANLSYEELAVHVSALAGRISRAQVLDFDPELLNRLPPDYDQGGGQLSQRLKALPVPANGLFVGLPGAYPTMSTSDDPYYSGDRADRLVGAYLTLDLTVQRPDMPSIMTFIAEEDQYDFAVPVGIGTATPDDSGLAVSAWPLPADGNLLMSVAERGVLAMELALHLRPALRPITLRVGGGKRS